MLLEVLFDPFGLPQEERDMLVGHVEELFEDGDRLLEFLDEAIVLLVAPSVAQGQELGMEGGEVGPHVAIEDFEVMSESAKFGGVDNCLSHETCP
jgi:hypothetical protein